MIDVFTPTIRHEGIKIVARCLARQTFRDFRWVIVDHDYDMEWFYKNIPQSLWSNTLYLQPKIQNPERKYKLWNTRNTGYQFLSAPLIVEVQDYHWFRSDTLHRFWEIYQSYPKSIVSTYYKIVGMKNIEKAMDVDDLEDKDLIILDETARKEAGGYGVSDTMNFGASSYMMYEMNVSSMPLEFLRKHAPVDETMDNGYLVDTHYFSIPAMCEGYKIFIDGDAKVYSFEHKIFEKRPDGWRSDCEVNQRYLVERYGKMLDEYRRKFQ